MRLSQMRACWIIFVLIVAAAGCNKATQPAKSTADSKAASAQPETSVPPAADWAKKPPRDWPQIVLTNDATFKGHTGLNGASAFLIETPRGRVQMATAKHLIGRAGGVEPVIALNKLDSVLLSWKLFPRTEPGKAIEAEKVGAVGLDRENADWLVLELKKSAKPLPATPLKLRSTPVQVGEKVFLIGCPYSERACKQNVYAGKVTKREFGTRFRFTLNPAVELAGFSGAPIVDAQGQAVGVATVWFDRVLVDGKDTICGGEDAAWVADLLKGQ